MALIRLHQKRAHQTPNHKYNQDLLLVKKIRNSGLLRRKSKIGENYKCRTNSRKIVPILHNIPRQEETQDQDIALIQAAEPWKKAKLTNTKSIRL
eukprot:12808728-Ditylum_brightwellii.AAC.1